MIAIADIAMFLAMGLLFWGTYKVSKARKELAHAFAQLRVDRMERDAIILQLVYEIERLREGRPFDNEQLLQEALALVNPAPPTPENGMIKP